MQTGESVRIVPSELTSKFARSLARLTDSFLDMRRRVRSARLVQEDFTKADAVHAMALARARADEQLRERDATIARLQKRIAELQSDSSIIVELRTTVRLALLLGPGGVW
jgi:hypothetical protein